MNKNYLPRSWRKANASRVRKVKKNDDRAKEQKEWQNSAKVNSATDNV